MRAAIYFTPPPGDPLTQAAAAWLGRDAFTGAATRPADPVLDPVVAEPARYGFHATIRAPFRIADGHDLDAVDARLRSFAASRAPVTLPRIALLRIGAFFALVPAEPSEPLAALEAAVLPAFEPLRAPLSEDEIARRRPESLSERARGHLARWGYPHVLEDFRFHMTLTGRVDARTSETVEARLAERFAPFLAKPLRIESLAVFTEPEPGAPFRVRSHHRFGASPAP